MSATHSPSTAQMHEDAFVRSSLTRHTGQPNPEVQIAVVSSVPPKIALTTEHSSPSPFPSSLPICISEYSRTHAPVHLLRIYIMAMLKPGQPKLEKLETEAVSKGFVAPDKLRSLGKETDPVAQRTKVQDLIEFYKQNSTDIKGYLQSLGVDNKVPDDPVEEEAKDQYILDAEGGSFTDLETLGKTSYDAVIALSKNDDPDKMAAAASKIVMYEYRPQGMGAS